MVLNDDVSGCCLDEKSKPASKTASFIFVMAAEGVCDITDTESLPSTWVAFGLDGACEAGRPLQTDLDIQLAEVLQVALERTLKPMPKASVGDRSRASGVSASHVSGLQPSHDRTIPKARTKD